MAATQKIRPALDWQPAGEYTEIRYETAEGIAKITIDRPEVRNAFRPQTMGEISDALERAREDIDIGVVVLTGEGPLACRPRGDQRLRGDTGYVGDDPAAQRAAGLPGYVPVHPAARWGVGRFLGWDLHVQMRFAPKSTTPMVPPNHF